MFWLWLLKLGPNLEPLRGPLLWTRIHFFELNQGRGGVWCPVAAWVYQVKISYTVWFLLQDFFWRSVRLFFSPQVSGDIIDILCKFKANSVMIWYSYILWMITTIRLVSISVILGNYCLCECLCVCWEHLKWTLLVTVKYSKEYR